VLDRRRWLRRVDHAPGARPTTRARAVRSRQRGVDPVHLVQRRRCRRHRFPRRAHDPVDRARRAGDRGPTDDAERRRGPAATADAGARRAHLELGCVLLGLGAERGPARERRLRVPAAEPAGEHRPRARVRAGGDRQLGGDGLPGRNGRRRPLHRPRRRRPRAPRDLGPVLWRLHGRVGGHADRAVQSGRRDVRGLELRLVPPDVGGLDVRRDDPGGRVERPDQPVRRALAGPPTPTGAERRPSCSRARRIGARRSARAGSSPPRSPPRAPRSSSSSTRARATYRWSERMRSTRSGERRRGSTGTFARSTEAAGATRARATSGSGPPRSGRLSPRTSRAHAPGPLAPPRRVSGAP